MSDHSPAHTVEEHSQKRHLPSDQCCIFAQRKDILAADHVDNL